MDKHLFMRRCAGMKISALKRDDLIAFHRLTREGIAKRDGDKVGRVVVAYGDGKKSPYGLTYADELRDGILW